MTRNLLKRHDPALPDLAVYGLQGFVVGLIDSDPTFESLVAQVLEEAAPFYEAVDGVAFSSQHHVIEPS